MATQTLRPNNTGSYSDWTPSAGSNWQCVDDTSANGDTDYIVGDPSGLFDLYRIQSNTIGGSDTIGNVQIFATLRRETGVFVLSSINAWISTNSTEDGASLTVGSALTTSYVEFSAGWTTSPDTGIAWTKTEIDNLQIGINITPSADPALCRCTQLYCVVTYTPAGGGSVKQQLVQTQQAFKRASTY